MIWHLFDYFYDTGSSYYAVKKALEPIHVMYAYNESTIWVVNNRYNDYTDIEVSVVVYDINSEVVSSISNGPLDIPADSSVEVLKLLEHKGEPDDVFFINAILYKNKEVISENFYWVSVEMDELDLESSTWYNTPVIKFANMQAL